MPRNVGVTRAQLSKEMKVNTTFGAPVRNTTPIVTKSLMPKKTTKPLATKSVMPTKPKAFRKPSLSSVQKSVARSMGH